MTAKRHVEDGTGWDGLVEPICQAEIDDEEEQRRDKLIAYTIKLWLSEIREKLAYGVPPLTLDECRRLFEIATGERIENLRRCAKCGGAGCYLCHGTGYEKQS